MAHTAHMNRHRDTRARVCSVAMNTVPNNAAPTNEAARCLISRRLMLRHVLPDVEALGNKAVHSLQMRRLVFRRFALPNNEAA